MNRRHFLILGLLTLVALVVMAVPPMKDPGFQGSLNKPVAAGGLATATDTFNRTDADPLSSPMSDGVSTWTSGPGAFASVKIVSNEVMPSSDPSDSAARVNSPTFSGNHRSTITLSAGSLSFSYVGAAVRIQGAADGSCYAVLVYGDATALRVLKFTDTGSLANAALGADFTVTSLVAGDTVGLSASGTSTVTLTVYVNGVSQGTRTDSTSPYTGGQPGFYTYDFGVNAFSATDE
jgi:hypothetical protein